MIVQITWKRAENQTYSPDTTFQIYRDTKPLSSKTISNETFIAEQDGSQLIFTEILPDTKTYYYAVLVKNKNNAPNKVIIPSVNATTIPAIGTYTPKQPETKSLIQNFNVISQNDSVIITYSSQKKGNRLYLYRSTKPFIKADDLHSAKRIATFIDQGIPFTDKPTELRSYYYALVDENDILNNTVSFEKGENTSKFPIQPINTNTVSKDVPQKSNAKSLRKIPLPDLNTITSEMMDTNTQKQNFYKIEKSISTYPTNEKHIFPTESLDFTGGETELSIIIKEYFFTNKFDECEKQLKDLIATCKSKTQKMRANFYLGEIYFFKGNKKKALLQFLETREMYPTESAKWINKVLEE